MRDPIGCNEEEALRYLGCKKNFLETLKAKKLLRPVVIGYYAYADLDKALDDFRAERDGKGAVLEVYESSLPEGSKQVRGKGSGTRRSSEELLRLDGS